MQKRRKVLLLVSQFYCLGTIPVFTTLRKVVVSMGGWWPEGVVEVKMGHKPHSERKKERKRIEAIVGGMQLLFP